MPLLRPLLRRAYSKEVTRDMLRLQSSEGELKERATTRGRFLLYHEKGLKPLLTAGNPKWMSFSEVRDVIQPEFPFVLLSVSEEGIPSLAVPTGDTSFDKEEGIYFSDLRGSLFGLEDPSEASLLTKGWSLLKWHQKTRFCRFCGTSNLVRSLDGHKINCGSCREIFYPPTYPVGIVLIMSPDGERILLVNLHRHPQRVYSCVAGFTDVGETLEACVAREAEEEVGLELVHESIQYVRSQHWPFPTGSLMNGFRATASSEDFEVLPEEVKDARWFTKKEIMDAIDCPSDFYLPPQGTIARHLIQDWLHPSLESQGGPPR